LSEYPHNGVICRNCCETIDLTALDKKERIPMADGEISAFRFERDGEDTFTLVCPKCGNFSSYEDTEMKPLVIWEGIEQKLDARITALEKKMEDPHYQSDLAKAILRLIEERSTAKGADLNASEPNNGLYR